MKHAVRLLARYWRALLFGAWFYALIGLVPGHEYQTFLRPEFGGLLAVGLLVLIWFLAAEMTQFGREHSFGLNDAIHLIILMIPLAYLPLARGVLLDSKAFQRRWTGLPENQEEKAPVVTNTPANPSGPPAEPAREVTLAELCLRPDEYKNRRVAVIGMLDRAPDIKKRFGDDACVLFRFVITCCAADAMPAAVLLIGKIPADWPADAWVRAVGRFTVREDHGRPVPTLELDEATRAATPCNPYLY